MRPDEIREYTDDQIRRRIGELEEELFRLRFQQATMELENPNVIGEIRRDIARMKTILRERELEEESGAAGGDEPASGEASGESPGAVGIMTDS